MTFNCYQRWLEIEHLSGAKKLKGMSWNIEEEFNVRQETIKCVVVGDTAVGKTRLICARTCNAGLNLPQMLSTHVPTVWAIDQYRIHKEVLRRSWMCVDGVGVSLRLWDTFGDHEKDRKFAYGRADVVLLCFSISNPQSLKHCKTKWYLEIRQYCPQAPIILVGCKSDLRHINKDDGFVSLCNERNRPLAKLVEEQELITREEGRMLASEIGATYYETSVYTHYGIDNVFENAMRLALRARRVKRLWTKNLRSVKLPAPQKPFLPPKPKEPDFRILTSSFETEMSSLLNKGFVADVKLEAAGAPFPAHKIILAAASTFFKKIFVSSPDCLKVNLVDLKCAPQSFRIFLSFLYCGELVLTPEAALGDIKEAAALTNMKMLEELIDDIEEHNGKKKDKIHEKYQEQFTANLKQVCLVEKLYADVIFIVDDGECQAHRSILMARCDVMAAMFGGDFKESITEKIPFPGATKSAFDICLHYLYTDCLDERVTIQNAAVVIELANRLCLPHLISLVEKYVITELKALHIKEVDVYEYVFQFLEICQLHNADQLFEWCQYYITTTYKNIELKAPMFLQKLDQEYVAHLRKNRWPPLQYLTELEYYDASMRNYKLNDGSSRFTFLLAARKRLSKYFNSFRKTPRSAASEIVPETTLKTTVWTILHKKPDY